MHVMKRLDRKEQSLAVGYYEERREPGGGPWKKFVELGRCTEHRTAAAIVAFLNGCPGMDVYPDDWDWTI
jgi:hypothetical protein